MKRREARFKYILRRRHTMNEKMLKELLGGVKTPEEVVAIAKEHGKELTLEQAQALLDRVKNSVTGELSEDDLEAVAGGVQGAVDVVKEWMGSTFFGV